MGYVMWDVLVKLELRKVKDQRFDVASWDPEWSNGRVVQSQAFISSKLPGFRLKNL